jgi:CheY-like chemotaxis protein
MSRVLLVGSLAAGDGALPFLVLASGHELRWANDGPGALEASASAPSDVVLFSLTAAGAGEFATRLRATPGCQGTLLVALAPRGADRQLLASAAGYDLYLATPVDRWELSAALGPPGARWRAEAAHPEEDPFGDE